MFMIHTVSFKFHLNENISFSIKSNGEKIKSSVDTPQTLWCFSKSHSSLFATSPQHSEKRVQHCNFCRSNRYNVVSFSWERFVAIGAQYFPVSGNHISPSKAQQYSTSPNVSDTSTQCPFTVLHLQLGGFGRAPGPPVSALRGRKVAVTWRPSSGLPHGAMWHARVWGDWQSGLLGCGVYPGVGEVLKESHVHISLEDG